MLFLDITLNIMALNIKIPLKSIRNNFIGYFWGIVEDKYWDQDMLTFKQIEEIFKIMVSSE